MIFKRKKRYKVKVTLSGYILVGLTLAVALAGVNTGDNLLYLSASALLALMTVSGLLSFLNLAFVRLEIRPPEEIFADTPAPFEVRIKGPWYPCFFIRLESPYGKERLAYFRRSSILTLWLRFPKRGSGELSELKITSGYPLGFFVRIRWIPLKVQFTVYPAPLIGRLPLIKEDSLRDRGGGEAGEEEFDEFRELRNYREGEPASRIAWKASARRGELLVKSFEGLSGQILLLDLSKGYDEILLGRATGLVLKALREGLAVGLRLPHQEIAPDRGEKHRRKLLEALAYA